MANTVREFVEESLELVKDPVAAVVILLDDEGNVIDGWRCGGKPYVILGAIEKLKLEFASVEIESR